MTGKIYKRRAQFGNDTVYIQYMKSELQSGLQVKMLYNSHRGVKSEERGTVKSPVYVNKSGGDCVKVDFRSGHRDFEVECWAIEMKNEFDCIVM